MPCCHSCDGHPELPLALRQRRHRCSHLRLGHGRELRRLPLCRVVLVHKDRSEALDKVGAVHDPASYHKVALQRRAEPPRLREAAGSIGLGKLQELEDRCLAEGAALQRGGEQLRGPAARLGLGLEHRDGVRDALGLRKLERQPAQVRQELRRGGRLRQPLQALRHGPVGVPGEVCGLQGFGDAGQLLQRHEVRCQLRGDGVARPDEVDACERHQPAKALGHAVGGGVGKAGVREEADVVLGHGQPGLLRGDAVLGGRAEGEAATHGDAVDECHRGLC
mmetsp:Transcript_69584/g.215099  ORF Transcript_69584/g.215099 Transcript_69584/m.215099 type:complete len:278 (+) Transcript_69584:153-986(+)